jgi:DNA-binding beta-propeller fold protein YncE
VTNKIYVANSGTSNVTVIDGNTKSTTTITDPNVAGARLSAVAIAVNQTTNKIYVVNTSFDSPGNVTVIDGATNTTTTVTDPNANTPHAVAVNSKTNKVYVANQGSGYPGPNHGNVTIIDGATNSTSTVADANAVAPQAIAVNEVTNKIYVANINDTSLSENGGVTVIDGATNSANSVKDPNAIAPIALTVDPATNKIYVANEGSLPEFSGNNPGCVTIIDGATSATVTVIDPHANGPDAVAINAMADKIYVANSGSVTVIDGGATATSHTLSSVLEGTGSGTVTSSPAGINCGTSCTASFATGTAVILDASHSSGSTFSGWSTNCTGTGACNVTMNSDEFVTATFNTPDFSLQPTSANLTVQRGGQVTDVITVAPLNGSFSNPVQLSCAVMGSTPPATCSLSATSVRPGANSATSTLTITAPTQAAQLIMPSSEGQLWSPLYAVFFPMPFALIGLGLTSANSKQRRRQLWLRCTLFLAFVALEAGCGGGSSNQSIQLPPQHLNYAVTVTATSGAIQHTTQLAVTVQ